MREANDQRMIHDVFAAQESAVENKRGDQTIAKRELGDSIYKLFAVVLMARSQAVNMGCRRGGWRGMMMREYMMARTKQQHKMQEMENNTMEATWSRP